MPSYQSDVSAIQPNAAASVPGGDAESAPSNAVARLIALDEGFYALTVVGEAGWAGPAPGFALPAVHISASPHEVDALEITDIYGHPAAWLGARHSTVFAK